MNGNLLDMDDLPLCKKCSGAAAYIFFTYKLT